MEVLKDGKVIQAVVVTPQGFAEWEESKWAVSVDAVEGKPDAYKDLKEALEMAKKPVGADAWFPLARRIASACKRLATAKSGTVFYYPMKDIDPEIYGSAVTFRSEVTFLAHRVSILDKRLNNV